MSAPKNGQMSLKEIRTGQVLNGVATLGGLNAMRMAVKEFKNSARMSPDQAAAKVARSKVIARAQNMKGVGRLVKNPRAAALALGGGALLLHGGELAGDAISARSLHHQAKASEQGIAKAYVSPALRSTGRGQNIEKAYRRFDPEADRQRRLGTYAGIAGGAGIVAGGVAAHGLKPLGQAVVQDLKSMKSQGTLKRVRRGGLAAGAALGAFGLGAAAYRRGIQVRNQPWT